MTPWVGVTKGLQLYFRDGDPSYRRLVELARQHGTSTHKLARALAKRVLGLPPSASWHDLDVMAKRLGSKRGRELKRRLIAFLDRVDSGTIENYLNFKDSWVERAVKAVNGEAGNVDLPYDVAEMVVKHVKPVLKGHRGALMTLRLKLPRRLMQFLVEEGLGWHLSFQRSRIVLSTTAARKLVARAEEVLEAGRGGRYMV